MNKFSKETGFKTDKVKHFVNKSFFVAFATLTIGAIIGVFMGYYHQILIALIALIPTLCLRKEIKKSGRHPSRFAALFSCRHS